MTGIYCVAVLLMGIVIAFADYQLFFYRDVIYMGLLAGILVKLPAIESRESKSVPSSSEEQKTLQTVPA
jgi:hypothetical protein